MNTNFASDGTELWNPSGVVLSYTEYGESIHMIAARAKTLTSMASSIEISKTYARSSRAIVGTFIKRMLSEA